MFRFTFTILLLVYCCTNVLTKTTKGSSTTTTTISTTTKATTSPTEKLFCATCSYEYTFAELRNQSTWKSPWSQCQNQTASSSTFGTTACHTLIRIDYARQYVTFYYNASYLSQKKLPNDYQRITFETYMSTNRSRVQLKAFYECSFENNCHLPLNRFLQLRTASTLAKYNYTNFLQSLNTFYKKPKEDIQTYFYADTLTSSLNGFCGDINQFDRDTLRSNKPKCIKKKEKLKSKSTTYNDEVKVTVYTCDAAKNTYCNTEKKLKQFLNGVILTDYMKKFLGRP